MTDHTPGHWADLHEVAAYYNVHRNTARRWVHANRLTWKRMGPRLIRVWLPNEQDTP